MNGCLGSDVDASKKTTRTPLVKHLEDLIAVCIHDAIRWLCHYEYME